MGLNKKGFIIVGVLIIIGLLFVFDGDITGKVVWEPVTDLSSCSVDIPALWNEVINESSVGITQIDEGCEFIAWKNISETEILILQGDINNTYSGLRVYDLPNGNVGNIVESSWIYAYYVNHTDVNITTNYSLETTVDGVAGLLFRSLTDWTLGDESETLAKYEQYFKIEVPSITWSVLVSNYMNSSFITNTTNVVNVLEVRSFESYISFFYDISNYSVITKPVFTQAISNFTFEANSSWNEAFDMAVVSNVASIDSGWLVTTSELVSSDGITTANLSGDIMYFKPDVGENGTDVFRMVISDSNGYDIYSNTFNVTIVDDINYAPILVKEFNVINVPSGGGVNVFLDVYFEDPDGDDMTYRTGGKDENLSINITGDTMTIRLKAGFVESSKIYIYASDGEFETQSDEIWIFDAGYVEPDNGTVQNDTNDSSDDLNATTSGDTTGGDAEGASSSSTGSDDDASGEGGLSWIWWVVGGVIVLGVVLFGIWFFVLRKGKIPKGDGVLGAGGAPVAPIAPSVGPGIITPSVTSRFPVKNTPRRRVPVNVVPKSPVGAYLAKLNLKK